VRNGYAHVTTLDEALRVAGEHSAKTLVFDVEPLVAHWNSDQQALDKGLAHVVTEASAVPGVQLVCFATNSARRPTVSLAHPGLRVVYLASAGKPFRVEPYQDFPAPGAVIGDQVLTDGLLARRLGYFFVHFIPERGVVPRGPWLLNQGGRAALPLVKWRRHGHGE
jgi:predicted HAD superfamily phosphohydrolase YqeG